MCVIPASFVRRHPREEIKWIPTGMSDEERIVCGHEERTGTRLRDVRCGTVAGIREGRESDKDRMGGKRLGIMPSGG